MIVKNEEDHLARCLQSVQHLVNEIIVVDTGSTDNTKSIAREFNANVYEFNWVDDFSKARNFSFKQATKDYIFWLDADDVLLEEEQQKLASLKQNTVNQPDAISMVYVLARDENNTVTHSVRRNRLVKRCNNFQWHGAVHEYLEVGGNILQSDIQVTHLKEDTGISYRNLHIYETMIANGAEFSPRDLYYYANECYDHEQFEKAVNAYKKFIDTEKGWVEDIIAAYGKLADCYISLNDSLAAIDALYQSFHYDIPRAENCCRLGYIYVHFRELNQAIFWYELATRLDYDSVKEKGGFVNSNCYTWLPHLQLCVCYDALQNHAKAYYHNSRAKEYNPTHEAIIHNDAYLKSKIE
ncbi:glycosyltransferase family 2 protein [Thalassobacillus sp. CUG 92003]|uniref:tetratricopeptide repeat-containing glycosyltransferase family 2 protein n=1 Tax=Thalassobacillus sp. CUG 92003 TaxID=2736641 RepID=UPI001C629DF3|nr:glycosyltransferase family 2 protein [Thalassobacillus sp. CUG 92003]